MSFFRSEPQSLSVGTESKTPKADKMPEQLRADIQNAFNELLAYAPPLLRLQEDEKEAFEKLDPQSVFKHEHDLLSPRSTLAGRQQFSKAQTILTWALLEIVKKVKEEEAMTQKTGTKVDVYCRLNSIIQSILGPYIRHHEALAKTKVESKPKPSYFSDHNPRLRC